MTSPLSGSIGRNARCDFCGPPPRPRRTQLTTIKFAAALPLELALHTLVVLVHPPTLVSAVVIVISSTVLAVWIVEPAVMRTLGSWLHASAAGAITADRRARDADGTSRTVPRPGSEVVVLDRPGDPVTSPESARAQRLAALARTAPSPKARIRRAAPLSNAPGPHGGWRP